VDREYLNVQEAADRIGVNKDFIYTACAVKGLRHIRLGGKRNIRIRPEDLDTWMESHAVVN
jgi:excisionase family DNA binding protein